MLKSLGNYQSLHVNPWPKWLLAISAVFVFQALQNWQLPAPYVRWETILYTTTLLIAQAYYFKTENLLSAAALSTLYLYLGFSSGFHAGYFCEVAVLIFLLGLLPAYRVLSLRHFIPYSLFFCSVAVFYLYVNLDALNSPFGYGYALRGSYLEETWLSTQYLMFLFLVLIHFGAYINLISIPKKRNRQH